MSSSASHNWVSGVPGQGSLGDGDLHVSPLPSAGGHVERGVKWTGCDFGLGASLPGFGSQLCCLLVGDVWNLLKFSVPQFLHLYNEMMITPTLGCGED